MNQNFSDSSINSICSRRNSAILRQYIVLFPSSRSLAIVLSYNEEVNLKVSLNIFLDSPFPLVEITISLSCHSVICLHSRNVEQQTLQAHYKLMLYFVFSIHSGGDRWLELAVFLPKNAASHTYLSSCKTHFLHESVDRTPIMIRFPVAYSIHSWISSSYTSGYCQIYTRGE